MIYENVQTSTVNIELGITFVCKCVRGCQGCLRMCTKQVGGGLGCIGGTADSLGRETTQDPPQRTNNGVTSSHFERFALCAQGGSQKERSAAVRGSMLAAVNMVCFSAAST